MSDIRRFEVETMDVNNGYCRITEFDDVVAAELKWSVVFSTLYSE